MSVTKIMKSAICKFHYDVFFITHDFYELVALLERFYLYNKRLCQNYVFLYNLQVILGKQ